MSEIQVLVPEKVLVSYRLASASARIGAHLLDFVFVLVALFASLRLIGMIFPGVLATAVSMIVATFGYFVYFILFEWLWNGKTPGKHFSGLRVRMQDGTPITATAALYRNLIRFADFFPAFYFAGLMTVFLSHNSQRVGDLIAGTIVASERETKMMNFTAPHNLGYHPLEQQVGDLRMMSRAEYVMLKQVADRFPSMPDEVRRSAVKEVWEPFAKKHSVPEVHNIHPLYLMEAVVMKYGRSRGLL